MSWQIQQSIALRNRDPFRTIGDFCDFVARTDLPFLQHAKIKSRPMLRYQQRRHARLVHANADSEARYAWLAYFKKGIAYAISVTDADLVIGKPVHREVLSELSEAEIVAAQKVLPEVVGVHLINEDRALLPTVAGEIRLPIAINVEPAYHAPFVDRRLPDRGTDGLALPRHVVWKADIYGKQSGHACLVEVNLWLASVYRIALGYQRRAGAAPST
jgi:hypothetical protein